MKNDKEKFKEHLPKEEESKEEVNIAQDVSKEQKEDKRDYAALWDKYMRTCADFDNARKRWDKEKDDIVRFSEASLLRELLVVVDEVEQALKMIKEHSNIEEITKGLEMTYNNFMNVLKKRGLKSIEAVGRDFDPHLHEIIASKEVEDNIIKPIVLEEIQKGYTFENKLLRTAKVIVGIKKQSTENREQMPEEKEQKIEDKKSEL
ncbi:MAG: nucleotide exchange factor GrpE [Candidatus Omnitrophota bacterium]|nr:nucleotide exchange factor GrpE [Candidatus Omnitrophota bacterium]